MRPEFIFVPVIPASSTMALNRIFTKNGTNKNTPATRLYTLRPPLRLSLRTSATSGVLGAAGAGTVKPGISPKRICRATCSRSSFVRLPMPDNPSSRNTSLISVWLTLNPARFNAW